MERRARHAVLEPGRGRTPEGVGSRRKALVEGLRATSEGEDLLAADLERHASMVAGILRRMTGQPPPIPEHIEHRIRTPDGRVLAVAEWGDPDGLPLFALHGTPGGRIIYWEDPAIYAHHGLRRLTVDRPGYGASTRQPGRSVSDFVADVETIAAELGIGQFAITGGSGGGPHALAVAALMPDRVLRCLVQVSIAPWDAEGLDWLDGMTDGNVEEFTAAAAGEDAHRAVAERERATTLERLSENRADFLGDSYEMSEADRAQMERHLTRIRHQFEDCLAPGVDGWVDDMLAFVRPWGFAVEDIRVPVLVSYGRDDNLVPAAHGDWLVAHIPGAIAEVSGAGHLGEDEAIERHLAWLAGRSSVSA
jgi:pimeloyl-ACP methyl ester carboxylesterase